MPHPALHVDPYADTHVTQLAAIVKNRLKTIQYRPELLGEVLAQTGLARLRQ